MWPALFFAAWLSVMRATLWGVAYASSVRRLDRIAQPVTGCVYHVWLWCVSTVYPRSAVWEQGLLGYLAYETLWTRGGLSLVPSVSVSWRAVWPLAAVLLQATTSPVPASTAQGMYLSLEVGMLADHLLRLMETVQADEGEGEGEGEGESKGSEQEICPYDLVWLPTLLLEISLAFAHGLVLPCYVVWYASSSGQVQWTHPAHLAAVGLWGMAALSKSGIARF